MADKKKDFRTDFQQRLEQKRKERQRAGDKTHPYIETQKESLLDDLKVELPLGTKGDKDDTTVMKDTAKQALLEDMNKGEEPEQGDAAEVELQISDSFDQRIAEVVEAAQTPEAEETEDSSEASTLIVTDREAMDEELDPGETAEEIQEAADEGTEAEPPTVMAKKAKDKEEKPIEPITLKNKKKAKAKAEEKPAPKGKGPWDGDIEKVLGGDTVGESSDLLGELKVEEQRVAKERVTRPVVQERKEVVMEVQPPKVKEGKKFMTRLKNYLPEVVTFGIAAVGTVLGATLEVVKQTFGSLQVPATIVFGTVVTVAGLFSLYKKRKAETGTPAQGDNISRGEG